MNQFIKLSSMIICFSWGVCTTILAGAAAMPSVHDMFKDVPQDELLKMMQEGQQFIQYLEEHGTPEEKQAFAQAMEDTLQNFTEDDWKEFEAIVETVQDKLPPLTTPEPAPTPVVAEPAKQEPVVVKNAVAIDNSLEKVLKSIAKAINAILLKAKSDKVLTERITIGWKNKDEFNEMARLLQVLQNKDHLIKLTTSQDEAIVTLLESIQNFNKRLQIENNQFIIADTFGLQADEQTTTDNLKKLNSIIVFFDKAIETLLPKIVKFLREYEPEALQKSTAHDKSAQQALDNATKIEKQKRPAGSMMSYDKPYSSSSRKPANDMYFDGYPGYQGSVSRKPEPEYLELMHQENLRNVPKMKKDSTKGAAGNEDKKDQAPKEIKKTEYDKAIDSLECYLDTYGNNEVCIYNSAIAKSADMYKPFGAPIDETIKSRVMELQEKRSATGDLQHDEISFLQKNEKSLQIADKNFGKNTQAAHSYYDELKDSIENIMPQIDEIQNVLHAIKSSIEKMTSKELEKLHHSTLLHTFEQRIAEYHKKFKDAQSKLKNMHRLHKLERQNPYEISAYNELATKVQSMHGLDSKIASIKSQIDALQKSIKKMITRRKRDENKQASQAQ